MSISVVVVDDHPLVVEAILSLLHRTCGDFNVAGIGANAGDVVELCRRNLPRIAIVDLHMPGDSYRAITAALQASPSTRIVAFSEAPGAEPAVRALDAGASGYALKGSPTAELVRAISSVLAGDTYITPFVSSREIARLREASHKRKAAESVMLSIREKQIVRLLMSGKTNREIADAINIREKTVKHYMTALIQKLHVRNRLEVMIAAQKLNEMSASANLHA
jgi:two-component system, NarL family, nitrate/nitrite response regulator NarL